MLLQRAMFAFLTHIVLVLRSALNTPASREAEILVLRHQLMVLNRKSRTQVRLRNVDRLILVWLYRAFPALINAITVVTPETVLGWHRRGFRAYWNWKSRRHGGRPRIDRELRDLIRQMSRDDPLWGAPRIHGELLMLGLEVAESTVGRYMITTRRPPSQGWKTFLRNQTIGIASIDLFVVPPQVGSPARSQSHFRGTPRHGICRATVTHRMARTSAAGSKRWA